MHSSCFHRSLTICTVIIQVFCHSAWSRIIQVRCCFVRWNNQEFGAAVYCLNLLRRSEREERRICTVVSDSYNARPRAVHCLWVELHNGWLCCRHWHQHCRMVRHGLYCFRLFFVACNSVFLYLIKVKSSPSLIFTPHTLHSWCSKEEYMTSV